MHLHSFKKFDSKSMQLKEVYKNISKFYLSKKYSILKSNKIIRMIYRNAYFYKYASRSFYRRSCLITGNCRSVFRFFKLSRSTCKAYASNGLFIGIQKASF